MERSENATVGERPDPLPDDQRVDEMIDEMVDESFPASDPPTGWAGEDPRDTPGPTRDHTSGS